MLLLSVQRMTDKHPQIARRVVIFREVEGAYPFCEGIADVYQFLYKINGDAGFFKRCAIRDAEANERTLQPVRRPLLGDDFYLSFRLRLLVQLSPEKTLSCYPPHSLLLSSPLLCLPAFANPR